MAAPHITGVREQEQMKSQGCSMGWAAGFIPIRTSVMLFRTEVLPSPLSGKDLALQVMEQKSAELLLKEKGHYICT